MKTKARILATRRGYVHAKELVTPLCYNNKCAEQANREIAEELGDGKKTRINGNSTGRRNEDRRYFWNRGKITMIISRKRRAALVFPLEVKFPRRGGTEGCP